MSATSPSSLASTLAIAAWERNAWNAGTTPDAESVTDIAPIYATG